MLGERLARARPRAGLLDRRDVARAAALGDEPAAGLQRREQVARTGGRGRRSSGTSRSRGSRRRARRARARAGRPRARRRARRSRSRASSTIDGASRRRRSRAPRGSRSTQRRGDAAGAAARVEHASRRRRSSSRSSTSRPIASSGARQALVGGGVPVSRHTFVRYRIRGCQPQHERARPRRRRARPGRRPRRRLAPARRARRPATMSGSVESGRPTPTRTRWKSGAAELALERLQAVVAGEPAAEPRRGCRRTGRSISSWTTSTRSRSSLKEPRAGPTERPGLVHVGLRAQHRDARAARAGAALGQLAGELLLRLRQLPARGRARPRPGSRRCAGCRRSRARGCRARRPASRPGVEPRSSFSCRRPRPTASSPVVALGLGLGLGLELLALERLAVLADQLGLGLDLLLDRLERRRGDRGDDGLLGVVEQRDAARAR